MPVDCTKAGNSRKPASVAGAPSFLPSRSFGAEMPDLARLMIEIGERV